MLINVVLYCPNIYFKITWINYDWLINGCLEWWTVFVDEEKTLFRDLCSFRTRSFPSSPVAPLHPHTWGFFVTHVRPLIQLLWIPVTTLCCRRWWWLVPTPTGSRTRGAWWRTWELSSILRHESRDVFRWPLLNFGHVVNSRWAGENRVWNFLEKP